MAAASWFLTGMAAGIAVIVLLTFFVLSRALCSITMKDAQASVSPGPDVRPSGLATTGAGIATFFVGG